jgi:hypothetical protein
VRRRRLHRTTTKQFSSTRFRDLKSTTRRSADETGIFVALQVLIFSEKTACASTLSRIFRHAEKSTWHARAHEKNFCAGSVCGRVDALHEAQIARISANRFAAQHVCRPRDASRGDDSHSGLPLFASARDLVAYARAAPGAPSRTPPGGAARRV